MERFYAFLRTMSTAQAVVLILVAVAAAGLTYGGYEWSRGSSSSGLAADEQLVPVQYGDLVRQVTTSGSLDFPGRDVLSFGSGGTVAEVMVKDGEAVSRGQPLARLDAVSAAKLAVTAAQARVDLETSEQALQDLTGPSPLLLAQAQQKVANAEFQLQAAHDALDAAREPYDAEQIKVQEQSVANAKLVVGQAEDALSALGREFSQSLAAAVLKNADAKIALDAAVNTLADFLPNYQGDLAQAVQDKANAESALVSAQSALDAYEKAHASTLPQARTEKADAAASLAEAQSELAKLKASRAAGTTGLDVHINALEAQIPVRQERLDTAKEAVVTVEQLEAAVDLAKADLEQAGTALAPVEKGPDAGKRQKSEAAVDLALADVATAQAELDALVADTGSSLLQAQVAKIRVAENKLDALVRQQSLLSADTAAVQDPSASVTVAKAEVDALRLGLSALESGASPAVVEVRQADLVQAWAKRAQREKELADMLAGADPVTVALRQTEVVVGSTSLDDAKTELDKVINPEPATLALRQSQAESARLALEQALGDLDSATLKAPFDGIVTTVSVEEGDQVGANAAIVEVVDPSVLEMDGIVDEIDVLLLRAGIPAEVTVDALPGQTLQGVVTEISAAGTNQQGVVTYPVRIRVQAPEGAQLRDGLSAVASLVLQREPNVLLVPQQSVFGTFQAPFVRVMTNNGVVERPVVLGNSDDFLTVVQDGLSQGDRVVMKSSQSNRGQSGGNGQAANFGGGAGGVRIRGLGR